MLSAIYFHDQSFLEADKIDDVRSDWSLPAEFISGKLAKTKVVP